MAQRAFNTTSSLRSTSGTWGQAQIVSVPGRIVLDLQVQNYDTAGHRHRDYALVDLPLIDAVQLRDLLTQAILASAASTPHAPAVWSDRTHSRAVRRSSRRAAA